MDLEVYGRCSNSPRQISMIGRLSVWLCCNYSATERHLKNLKTTLQHILWDSVIFRLYVLYCFVFWKYNYNYIRFHDLIHPFTIKSETYDWKVSGNEHVCKSMRYFCRYWWDHLASLCQLIRYLLLCFSQNIYKGMIPYYLIIQPVVSHFTKENLTFFHQTGC